MIDHNDDTFKKTQGPYIVLTSEHRRAMLGYVYRIFRDSLKKEFIKRKINYVETDLSLRDIELKDLMPYLIESIEYNLKSKEVEKRDARKISNETRYLVFANAKFTCKACGLKSGELYEDGEAVVLEVDHINPVAKGGTNAMGNLQSLCRRCNSGKKHKYISLQDAINYYK